MAAWFDDLPLDFTRADTRTAERALITGYGGDAFSAPNLVKDVGLDASALNMSMPPKFLIRAIMNQARLANRLTVLLGEVFADPTQEAIHGVLRPTIAGHEAEITEAVRNRQPSLERLSLLPPTAEVWGAHEEGPRPLATPGLEKILNEAAGFADVGVFRRWLAEAEVRTARIDIGGRACGTGFLVADQLLLTNWHVVSETVTGAVALFDHSVLNPSLGRAVPFAADWQVAHSDHDTSRTELGASGPPLGTWDFALVRLTEPVGAQAIGPDPAATTVDKRGHYQLDGTDYTYVEDEPLLVVGHPDGRPIQLSYAAPSGARPTKHGNRVRYQTNTESGLSGSPVFNREFRVVALHHAGGPTRARARAVPGGGFNQGIPIVGVVAELKQQLAGRPELVELGL
ncbi:MAG TPA: serine protease [Pseudonocardia sp.]|jgi:V8-like Glu-specific endopeptidase|nr:serine protease [Pseudonocardia sp.]